MKFITQFGGFTIAFILLEMTLRLILNKLALWEFVQDISILFLIFICVVLLKTLEKL
jgi:hypothetical protein